MTAWPISITWPAMSTEASYIIGSQAVQGLTATSLANPMLSWEQMKIWNVGLDFGLFHNRLYGEADVFYRVRDGIPGMPRRLAARHVRRHASDRKPEQHQHTRF